MGSKPATFKPSSEQQLVIDHRGGHLQAIACAGAGKTEAISRRVTALVEKGVEPEQIIAFTFTERAAASLKARITSRIAQSKGAGFLDRLGPMFIGTIHSYCLRLLQDHVPGYGNHDILDENRLAGLLSREHKRLELGKLGSKHWRPIVDFLRNADVVENELIPLAKLKETPFGDCYMAYRQTLKRYHFLTYGQLITAAIAALEQPKVHARVHGRLRHLIVDEYQDINPSQERLIELLAQPPVNLLCIGLNYRRHAAEGNMLPPQFPVLFVKASTAVQNPGDPIVLPRKLASNEVDYECELAVVIGRRCKTILDGQVMQDWNTSDMIFECRR